MATSNHTGPDDMELEFVGRRDAVNDALDLMERDESEPGVRMLMATLMNGRYIVRVVTGYQGKRKGRGRVDK